MILVNKQLVFEQECLQRPIEVERFFHHQEMADPLPHVELQVRLGAAGP